MAVPAEKPNWIGDEIFEQIGVEPDAPPKKSKWAMKLAEDAAGKPTPPKTPDLNEQEKTEANALLYEVLDWVAKNGIVRTGTQETLGLSHHSIWKWRKGKNAISKIGLIKLREAVARIRDIEKQQARLPQRKGILQTSTVKIVAELLASAIEDREKGFCVVNGPSGQGKTTALQYALANGPYEKFTPGVKAATSNTRYILLEGSQFTRPAAMLKKILKKLGLTPGKNISENIDITAEFLQDNPVAIIIDESDWWQRQQWLNALRCIWQGSHAPIFLLGCPRYMEELLRPEDEYRQLNSRIAMKYRFSALSLEEVMPFFKESGCGEWAKDTIEEIYALSGGNLHDLLSLMDKVKTVGAINPAVPVSPEFVRAVKKQFLS